MNIERAITTETEVTAPTNGGVCSKEIRVRVVGDTIISVGFQGGCPGNTLGISQLVAGMDINNVISRLEGIRCGRKSTSCPDQLAQVLKTIVQQNKM